MNTQLAEAPRRDLPARDNPQYFQHRAIAAGPPVTQPQPEPAVHPLIPKLGKVPAVKTALAEADKAQAEFEREYKELLPVINFERQHKASLNRIGATRTSGDLMKAISDVAAMSPEQLRAAQFAAKQTIAKHSTVMLAKLESVVDAAIPELERLAAEAHEDETKLARKWGLPDEPGPASRLVADIKARVIAVSGAPLLGFGGPDGSRNRLAIFER